MATRKIKDAKDLNSNELIYFKGHAKATYMSDGRTVEDAINNIDVGGDVVGADCKVYVWEFDGTLANASSGTISQEVADELSQAEVVVLKMGDDSEGISMASSMVSVSGGSLIIMFAQHLNDTLKQYYFVVTGTTYTITDIESPILTQEDWDSVSSKANNAYVKSEYGIPKTDLDQEVNDILHAVEVTDLPKLKAYVDGLVVITNDLNADIAQLYEDKQDTISDLDTIRSGAEKGATALQEVPSEYVTETDLAKVATSGSYNDLADKPTIPSVVTESTVSNWGFTKNTGTYSKPSTGIPKTDLASAVQTSLNNADKSVQYTINGEAVIENGKIIDGNSGVFYALPSADDDAKAKADYIIASEEYVNSKVGSGGGGSSGGGSGAYPVVNYGDVATNSINTFELSPNTMHIFGNVDGELRILFGAETSGFANEYFFQFNAPYGSNVILILPSDVLWGNENSIDIDEGYVYQVSILNNVACWVRMYLSISGTDPA